jgi:YidC/Oxa1 family membrane protein insertase
MEQKKNLLLFVVLAFLVTFAWMDLRNRFFPPPKPAKHEEAAATKNEKENQAAKPADVKAFVPEPPLPVTPTDKLLSMGSRAEESNYQLAVELDPLGAGVRSVVLNKFKAADDHGRPTQDLLELVPASANLQSPSYVLYGYDVKEPNDDRPLDTLGRSMWKVLGDKPVTEDVLADGRKRQRVSFQAEAQGVVITKTFTLTEGDYHLGMEVKLARKPGVTDKDLRFRYQVKCANGLPIEGPWYTSTFQNGMVARVNDRGSVDRNFQDMRTIVHKSGGDLVKSDPGMPIRYAMVAVQYFAAGLVVDDEQAKQNFVGHVRPTLESAFVNGQVLSVAEDGSSLVLRVSDPSGSERSEQKFYVQEPFRARFRQLQKGIRILVQFHSGSYSVALGACPHLATDWFDPDQGGPHGAGIFWRGDVTMRVATEPVEIASDAEVVHKYLLYHGPVKVSQLYGAKGVRNDLVDRYHDTLHLNTLTDYQSPGAMGTFSSTIGFTWLVIFCTNVMHSVLGILHYVIPSYGLCIILLTVLVRGLMFPVSRKQQQTTMRMQQLAPELKKLQEKLKDDRQALGMAQMELYRKHGVNPFGSCWFLLLQMPIFMGLYFALQESIHFRLARFWPTWVANLAAPDMMIWWGEKIPWISRLQDYGGFFYLGPYFNLLPVIAVVLMIMQQKMLTPPPTDEQQAMQMKIMRYMMIFFGLMFYKVAAGLCIYFIASSLWGFAERRMLTKFKPSTGGPVSSDGLFQRMLAGASTQPATAAIGAGSSTAVQAPGGIAALPAGERGRRREKQRSRRRSDRPEVAEPQANGGGLGGWWRERRRRLREWWAEVLEQARKR